jgi:hypothetical protein
MADTDMPGMGGLPVMATAQQRAPRPIASPFGMLPNRQWPPTDQQQQQPGFRPASHTDTRRMGAVDIMSDLTASLTPSRQYQSALSHPLREGVGVGSCGRSRGRRRRWLRRESEGRQRPSNRRHGGRSIRARPPTPQAR